MIGAKFLGQFSDAKAATATREFLLFYGSTTRMEGSKSAGSSPACAILLTIF
jgi:hypothetical protein